MALKDLLPMWAQRLLVPGSNALAVHDAIEGDFAALEADIAQAYDDTLLPDASTAGLDRWGLDLDERRLPTQTDDQYRARLLQIKQGDMVTDEGIRGALDKWDAPYTMVEFGDQQTFWDLGFYDTVSIDVQSRVIVIIFADPYPPITQAFWDFGYYDANPVDYTGPGDPKGRIAAMNNAINDAKRVKAAGVQIIAYLPASLA